MANEIYIYDAIGESFWEAGVTDKSFRDDLRKFKDTDPITVRVNSPGGSVSHAVAIKTMLDQWKGPVSIQIDGLAASAASYISMAGQHVTIAEGSLFMIHNPWSMIAGDAKELRKAADMLDKLGVSLTKAYADRSGKDMAELANMMDETTWLTADEAVEHGFVHAKVDELAQAFVIPESFGFKNVPQPAEPPKQRVQNRLAAMERQVQLTRAAIA
jgi:ATP-dependent Clp protease protease subunit